MLWLSVLPKASAVVTARSSNWLLPSRRAAMTLALVWGGFWILIQLGSSYALAPSLPPTRYYGQVARELENFATFKGSVISPTIGNTTVPDYGFAKTAEFRDNLARGEFVSAIVIPAGPTPKLAPIIRVADDRRQEIVLLAQRHRDLVFGLRTGASTLRLRGLLFMLGDVFPTGSDGSNASDTLRLSGRYDARLVEMRVTNRRESRDRALAVGTYSPEPVVFRWNDAGMDSDPDMDGVAARPAWLLAHVRLRHRRT